MPVSYTHLDVYKRQGYNGRSDKKSTGLGLYLCKKTADKLNVKVNVFSEVGKGTTFKINLERRKLELE